MRIWLEAGSDARTECDCQRYPEGALREQNLIVAAGKLGQGPTLPDQQFEYTIQGQGRLTN